jgi:hypothetical protein
MLYKKRMEHLPFIISAIGAVIPLLRKCSIFKDREFGVCILKKTGMTTLINSVKSKSITNKYEYVFIDVDEHIKNSFTATELEHVKEYKDTDSNALRNLIIPKISFCSCLMTLL